MPGNKFNPEVVDTVGSSVVAIGSTVDSDMVGVTPPSVEVAGFDVASEVTEPSAPFMVCGLVVLSTVGVDDVIGSDEFIAPAEKETSP